MFIIQEYLENIRLYELTIRACYLFVIINSDDNNDAFHSIENANKCRQQDMAKITSINSLFMIGIIYLFYDTLNDKMSTLYYANMLQYFSESKIYRNHRMRKIRLFDYKSGCIRYPEQTDCFCFATVNREY